MITRLCRALSRRKGGEAPCNHTSRTFGGSQALLVQKHKIWITDIFNCWILNFLFRLFISIYLYVYIYLFMEKSVSWLLRHIWVIIHQDFLKEKKKCYSAVLRVEVFIKPDEGFVSTPVSEKVHLVSTPYLPEASGNLHSFFSRLRRILTIPTPSGWDQESSVAGFEVRKSCIQVQVWLMPNVWLWTSSFSQGSLASPSSYVKWG